VSTKETRLNSGRPYMRDNEICVHADRSVEKEHPSPKQHAEDDESEVQQAVLEAAPLAVAVHRADRAPERGHAEEIEPEAEVLAGALIDEVGDEQHGESKRDRDFLPERELPLVVAARYAAMSMDMNQSATAAGATRKVNFTLRRATNAARTVAASIQIQLLRM